MALTPAPFSLDQAVDNALARVHFHIRMEVERHEAQLANRMLTMRVAWRNRQLLLLRELCGVAFPSAHMDLYRVMPLRHQRFLTKD